MRLRTTVERSGIVLHAYALMPNHYHLLVECPVGGLPKAMKLLNAPYAQEFNWRHGYDGHLFRGRYRSLLIENDAYLVEVARYIHRNSAAASLAEHPLLDPWCSHHLYVHGTAPAWLTTERVLSYFGGDTGAFGRFVAADSSAAARAVIEAIDQGRPAVGSRTFLHRLRAEAPRNEEMRTSTARLLPVDLDLIEQLCAEHLHDADVPLSVRSADLCLTIGRRLGVPLEALARRFDLASVSTVRTRIRRLEQRASGDAELKRIVAELSAIATVQIAA